MIERSEFEECRTGNVISGRIPTRGTLLIFPEVRVKYRGSPFVTGYIMLKAALSLTFSNPLQGL